MNIHSINEHKTMQFINKYLSHFLRIKFKEIKTSIVAILDSCYEIKIIRTKLGLNKHSIQNQLEFLSRS